MGNSLKQSFAVLILLLGCSNEPQEISYPNSQKIDFVETIHGYATEDQSRWL